MKQKLKQPARLFLAILLLFSVVNCTKDSFEDIQNLQPNEELLASKAPFQIDYLSASQAPVFVKEMLPSRNRGNNLTSTSSYVDSETGAVFDEQTIMKVTDTLGNTNYTIRFGFPHAPERIFYNLIVGRDAQGVMNEPFIVRYVSDSTSFDAFKSSKYDFSKFRGKITYHKYADFFGTDKSLIGDLVIANRANIRNQSTIDTQTSCPTEFDEFGDPIACDTVIIDGTSDGFDGGGGSGTGTGEGGTSTSGDGTSSGGTIGGGSSAQCSWSATWHNCGGSNGNIAHDADVCGGDGLGAGWIIVVDCGDLSENNFLAADSFEECPECTTPTSGIGVLVPPVDSATNEDDFIPASAEDLLFLENLLNTPPLWKANPGILLNRPSLAYSHTALVSGGVMYRLNNGLILYQSNSPRFINGEFKSNLRFSPEASIDDSFYYINNPAEGNNTWYEFKLPPPEFVNADVSFLFNGFLDVTKMLGRYVLPVEDIIILIDGKDLDGETASRLQAGIFLVIGIVPGSKVVKPISKLVKGEKAWEIIVKIAGKDALKSSDEIFALLKTESNTAFFWSGNTLGVGGETFAKEFAQKNGGQTLEALLEFRKIELPRLSRSDPVTKEIWDQVSESYAKQALGTVKAIVGKSSTAESVWKSIELPALMDNPNVTRIIEIDPLTLKETILK
jgi:uncharacterized membrane protein YgcG/DNA-directed RNA polymerase subunit H (RpoH/RPB5)